MRRTLTFLLALALLLALAACDGAGEGPNVDLDRNFAQEFAFCATEDAVYFSQWAGDDAILYGDKSSGTGGILCGKPECDHKSADCNAVVDYAHAAIPMGMADYDGKLYVATSWGVYRMDYDGTNHESLYKVPSELINKMNFHNVFFHRGYAYYVGASHTVEDGVAVRGPFAYRVSLTDPDEEPAVIFEKLVPDRWDYEKYDMVDHCLYLFLRTWGMDDATRGDNWLHIERFDIETGRSEVLYDRAIDFTPYEFWALDDTVLMDDGAAILELDWKTGTFSQRFRFDDDINGHSYFAENQVIRIAWVEKVENWYKAPRPYLYWVKDFEGSMTASGRIEPPEFGEDNGFATTTTFIGADDEALYVLYNQISAGGQTESWTKSRLVQAPLDGSAQRTIAEYDYISRIGEHR